MDEAKAVYDKLIEIPLFCGVYDAKHGNEHFMYGICTVMEQVANMVSDELLFEYEDLFHLNMTASKQKVKQTERSE